MSTKHINFYSIVVFAAIIFRAKAVQFNHNGYHDLVISISPDVEEGQEGKLIVDNIKVLQKNDKNLTFFIF